MGKLTGKNKERARREARERLHIVQKVPRDTDDDTAHDDDDLDVADTPRFSPFMKAMVLWTLIPAGTFFLLLILLMISRL